MDYPLLNLFLTMMWIFLWVIWFTLIFQVVLDVFRDDTLGGWAKAAWTVLVIVLPFVGVLAYLVARGHGMGARELAWRHRGRTDSYEAARSAAKAEELAHLNDLREHGDLTVQGYERVRNQVLAG